MNIHTALILHISYTEEREEEGKNEKNNNKKKKRRTSYYGTVQVPIFKLITTIKISTFPFGNNTNKEITRLVLFRRTINHFLTYPFARIILFSNWYTYIQPSYTFQSFHNAKSKLAVDGRPGGLLFGFFRGRQGGRR